MDMQAALWFASAGWPVFPTSPNTKRPLLQGNGFKDASVDRSWIGAIWGRHRHAMVAAPTGAPIGHFVLDLDPGNNPELPTWPLMLADLEQRLGVELPRSALMVETPRKGLHMYFQMPDGVDVRNTTGLKLFKGTQSEHKCQGIDIRGTGGYVVVPPSVRRGQQAREENCDGIAYNWIGSRPTFLMAPEAPPELIEHVRFQEEAEDTRPISQRAAARPPEGYQASDDTPLSKFVAAAFDGECERVRNAPKGTRNAALNNAALALGKIGAHGLLSFQEVEAALLQAAEQSGLVQADGRKQCQATIKSGWGKGLQEPRDLGHVGTRSRGSASSGPPPLAPLDEIGDDVRAMRGSPEGGGGGKAPGKPDATGGDGEPPELDPLILAENAKEPLNDLGNARRMLRWFGRDLMIVRDVGHHIWRDTHWSPDGADEVFQEFAQITSERIADEANHIAASWSERKTLAKAKEASAKAEEDRDADDISALEDAARIEARINKTRGGRRKFATSCGNSSKIAGMQNQARSMVTISPDLVDADPMAINVLNGTLRVLETRSEPDPDDDGKDRAAFAMRLDPHERGDLIAKIMTIRFDPDAKCPGWLAFVERFQPEPEVRRFLQQWSGLSLTGRMVQHFVFHYGLGANGKSTFMEVLARLAGSYAKSLPAEAITGDLQRRGDQATPEFARLPGARMVRCAELPRGQGIKESVLKTLTGGEPMLVRYLHEDFFEFRPSFKAQGSGNDRPPIGGVDEGIWRRMKLVPWRVIIPEGERRDFEEIVAELLSEGEGILNWMLAGLTDFLANGLVIPEQIRAATDDYRDDMDPVGSFLRACVNVTPEKQVTARQMFKSYEAWCHANSVKRFAESTFAKIMEQKGMPKTRGRIRYYVNAELHDVPDDPDATGRRGDSDEDPWKAPDGYD